MCLWWTCWVLPPGPVQRLNCFNVVTIFITDNSNNFYNFTSKTFTSTKDQLSKIELSTGSYSFDVQFAAVGGSLKTYTVNIIAEIAGNIKTVHADYVEVRNADNSINVNQSVGSRNNLVQKIINFPLSFLYK